jgi:hypothetical protein
MAHYWDVWDVMSQTFVAVISVFLNISLGVVPLVGFLFQHILPA